MHVRTLTISYHTGFGGLQPAIHISGRTLEKYNFHPGDQLIVKLDKDRMLITKLNDAMLFRSEQELKEMEP